MVRTTDDAMASLASGASLAQLPVMLALVSYYSDPLFTMYTTNLRNVTNTRDIDIELEDFSASVLYTTTSAIVALFALTSRKNSFTSSHYYTAEALEEAQMWDMIFWFAVILQHTCIVTFMCSPIDWYFLALTVTGITLMLMLLSRLPLVQSGRSRENVLLLLYGLLFVLLYSAVRLHGHVGFMVGLFVMDNLILIGHTYDQSPDMLTVSNGRLCYTSGMSAMILFSYARL